MYNCSTIIDHASFKSHPRSLKYSVSDSLFFFFLSSFLLFFLT